MTQLPYPYTTHEGVSVFMHYVPKGKRKAIPLQFTESCVDNAKHLAWEYLKKNGGKYTHGYSRIVERQMYDDGRNMVIYDPFSPKYEIDISYYNK